MGEKQDLVKQDSSLGGVSTLSTGAAERSRLSRHSSIASRVQKANFSVDAGKLWGIAIVIALTLLLVNSLAYVIVEYGIFGGDSDFGKTGSPPISDGNSEPELGMTGSVPTSNLDDAQFLVYVGFIMWATMVLTGLGTELLVWLMFLQGGWNQQKEDGWKLAQFFFPILGATTVGLAISHNFLALPFLVVTMWKFGFPETILYLYGALYEAKHSRLERAVDFMNGAGTAVHHSSSALYVAMVVTGALPSTRVVLQVTLPLLIQHWFILLRYTNKLSYVVLELLSEVWFEWTALSSLEGLHNLHWTGGIIAGAMLFAHWLYLVAGGLSLFISSDSLDANPALGRLAKMSVMKKHRATRSINSDFPDLDGPDDDEQGGKVGDLESPNCSSSVRSVVRFNDLDCEQSGPF